VKTPSFSFFLTPALLFQGDIDGMDGESGEEEVDGGREQARRKKQGGKEDGAGAGVPGLFMTLLHNELDIECCVGGEDD
jgi:hypothetical protein